MYAQEVVGNTVYAGGYFDYVGLPGPPHGTQLDSSSPTSCPTTSGPGSLIESFAPVINGPVKCDRGVPGRLALYVAGSSTRSTDDAVEHRRIRHRNGTNSWSAIPAAVGGPYVIALAVTDRRDLRGRIDRRR